MEDSTYWVCDSNLTIAALEPCTMNPSYRVMCTFYKLRFSGNREFNLTQIAQILATSEEEALMHLGSFGCNWKSSPDWSTALEACRARVKLVS